ncbi:hypothetical protein [Lysinibacillus sp. OL1]|nr:hypothetical protein [Lysinibacillus sp. OL1]
MKSQQSIVDGMGPLFKKKTHEEAAYLEFLKIQMTIFDPEFVLHEMNDTN